MIRLPIQMQPFSLADRFNQAWIRAHINRAGSMRACHEIALTSTISHLECIVNSNDRPAIRQQDH